MHQNYVSCVTSPRHIDRVSKTRPVQSSQAAQNLASDFGYYLKLTDGSATGWSLLFDFYLVKRLPCNFQRVQIKDEYGREIQGT
jgi:hypothetical protein